MGLAVGTTKILSWSQALASAVRGSGGPGGGSHLRSLRKALPVSIHARAPLACSSPLTTELFAAKTIRDLYLWSAGFLPPSRLENIVTDHSGLALRAEA